MADWSKLKYHPSEKAWLLVDNDDIEYFVEGSKEAPDPEALELAELVWKKLQTLEKQAIRYLNKFIDPRFKRTGEWSAASVEIKYEEVPQLEVKRHEVLSKEVRLKICVLWLILEGETMDDSDLYGLWHVKFAYEKVLSDFYEMEFGRQSY